MFRPEIRYPKVYCGKTYFGYTQEAATRQERMVLRYCNRLINHGGDCGYEAPTAEEHIIKGEN